MYVEGNYSNFMCGLIMRNTANTISTSTAPNLTDQLIIHKAAHIAYFKQAKYRSSRVDKWTTLTKDINKLLALSRGTGTKQFFH